MLPYVSKTAVDQRDPGMGQNKCEAESYFIGLMTFNLFIY